MNVPYFRKKRTEEGITFPFPLGMSLLFVCFLALCIFSFAVLSLLTARNEYKISQKTAEHQSAYYAASNKAEDRIAELNEEWKDAEESGKKMPEKVAFQIEVDSESVLSVVVEAESENTGETTENGTKADTETAAENGAKDNIENGAGASSENVMENRTGEGAESGYRIVEWKVISTGEWEPETTIPVMTPGVS
ncbi:hypothetical protein ACTQZS_11725 [Bilifractor sp. LCP19S3_H10]|uniref:hypothetical protein n=1 Tax=Bilifractor sp. LCP19S3_H10 TaxID=3438736 RepID=UPI003F92CCF6